MSRTPRDSESLPSPNDLLVWSFLEGRDDAFDELVRRIYRQLVRAAYRPGWDADLIHDSVLEALVKVQNHLTKNRDRYAGDHERYGFGWFWSLAVRASRNKYLDLSAARVKAPRTVPLEDDMGMVARIQDSESLPEPLRQAIARWAERDPDFRLMLQHIEAGANNRKAAELVAAETGRSYGAISMMFYRYRRRIAAELPKELVFA